MIFDFCILLLLSVPALAQQQIVTSPTLLYGTWSSGSKNVQTGSGFANPLNTSFTYPKTSGVSYSFTSNGYFEIARYRFNGNGSQPKCITGIMNWSHGTYIINADNSINMTTFGDGYQQIQDPCAAVTNFIENYNYNESYTGYVITTDPTTGLNTLQLYGFDGSPVAPMEMVSTTPNMLPLQKLRNVTEAPSSNVIAKRSAAHPRWSQSNALLIMTVLITTVVGGVAGPMLL